ncbi:MAG: MarR family transcriptional regulator [Chloroflexi bacterium]|nr:MarR family transcriptional regulator [Chloroflexota bacterium]
MDQSGNGDSAEAHSAREGARELTMLIGQVNSGLYRARELELRPLGIPMMHSAVLWALRVLDSPAAPAEISRMLLRRHQSVLQLLSRMEKQGYVTVLRGSRKGGPVKVVMTDKGREAVDLAWEREQVVAEIISSLSEEERGTLRVLLERLRDKASAIGSRLVFPQQSRAELLSVKNDGCFPAGS